MYEKESITAVWCELKIPSLGITVQPRDAVQFGIFKPNLKTIKDSYNLTLSGRVKRHHEKIKGKTKLGNVCGYT